jgi:ferric-dicitrate binding protein FerR (iron transport regulator)
MEHRDFCWYCKDHPDHDLQVKELERLHRRLEVARETIEILDVQKEDDESRRSWRRILWIYAIGLVVVSVVLVFAMSTMGRGT